MADQLPFSNGKGGPGKVAGRAPPNNFLTNPRGNNSGAGTKGVQSAMQSRPQPAAGTDPELNTETMAEGGPAPLLPDPAPTRASECSIGAGQGAGDGGRKPYKLGG